MLSVSLGQQKVHPESVDASDWNAGTPFTFSKSLGPLTSPSMGGQCLGTCHTVYLTMELSGSLEGHVLKPRDTDQRKWPQARMPRRGWSQGRGGAGARVDILSSPPFHPQNLYTAPPHLFSHSFSLALIPTLISTLAHSYRYSHSTTTTKLLFTRRRRLYYTPTTTFASE